MSLVPRRNGLQLVIRSVVSMLGNRQKAPALLGIFQKVHHILFDAPNHPGVS
jgi:hypothetical protein